MKFRSNITSVVTTLFLVLTLVESRVFQNRGLGHDKSKKILVCYFTNWAQYRSGDGVKFMPEDIDADLCTHIHYAFGKIVNGKILPVEWNDESTDWSTGLYADVLSLKNQNPNLKVLLSVGGWNHGGKPFTDVVKDKNIQHSFVNQAYAFIKQHNFDGLDLDWEYPGDTARGSELQDKQRFTELLISLRNKFGTELLLTAATGAGKQTVENGYEVKKISEILDYVALMAYDMHGSWETTVGFNAPLYARKDEIGIQRTMNVNWAVTNWIEKGCPPEKLVMGIGTYGRSFRLSDPSKTTPGEPASGPGYAGPYTKEAGFMAHYEICLKIKEGWTVKSDEVQKSDYAFRGDEWVGFDGLSAVKQKVDFILARGLAGAMVWALDLDDFKGRHCGQGKYPIIKKIKQELEADTALVASTEKNPEAPTKLPTAVTRKPTTGTTKLTTAVKTISTVEPVQSTAALSTTKSTAAPTKSTENPSKTTTESGDVACKFHGQMSSDQKDCNKFYVCYYPGTTHETLHHMSCAFGLHFDSVHQVCDFEANVQCNQKSGTKTKKTTEKPGGIPCRFHGEMSADPENCDKFYMCYYPGTIHEKLYHMSCPTSLHFNAVNRSCDYITNARCNT